MVAGSPCLSARGPHRAVFCMNLVQQYRREVVGTGQAGSGPGSPLSASNQLLQVSGYSAAPPGSDPKKKSVDVG